MIKEAIFKIVDKQDLTQEEAYEVVNEIMSGQTTPTQTAAFLAALSTKSTTSETIDEISGCAKAMQSLATPFTYDAPVLEIVGTGGDKAGTFNISTTAAFIIAAGGVKVAKHGNRAASSLSGSADCQEALGVNIHQDPRLAKELLDEVGICFFFAQDYHSAMKYVGPIRKELGIRTVFNILGPLTNPSHPTYMLMGVYDKSLVEPLAEVLQKRGVMDGRVVVGMDVGVAISSVCDTYVCEFHPDSSVTYTIHPESFGIPKGTKDELKGGDPEENARVTRAILDGSLTGTKRDTVVLNAAAGLYIANTVRSLKDGIDVANNLIDSGAALRVLDDYTRLSNELAEEEKVELPSNPAADEAIAAVCSDEEE
ncbi:MAG: anthranilate phosphoribosyltransferase [Eggerthellaceae bacterium]|nr:anthranilate phosphoribosyltransferase [Eggerthellaceae bacterium]